MSTLRALFPASILFVAALIASAALLMTPSAASAQSVPPDVVRLRDGTFLRGTVIEHSPSRVVLMMPTGEVRTYPTDQVEWAGPAPDATSQPIAAAPPAAAASTPMARLRVSADDTMLTLHQLATTASLEVWTPRGVAHGRADSYSLLCNAPCTIEVPAGTYQLGISRGTGDVQRAGRPVHLRGPMDVHLEYGSRSAVRALGWVTFVGGLVGGALLFTFGMVGGEPDPTGLLVAGPVIGVLGVVIGLPLAALNDHAAVRF